MMAERHERFDGLALDHVLGELSGRDASAFRHHLRSCSGCRSRVAELRGIATQLGEIEREELSRAQLRTEVIRRQDDASEPAPRRITVGHVTAATVLVLFFAAGMAFWNLHLRTVVQGYEAVIDAQSQALRDMATGVPLETEFGEDVSGRLVTTGDRLAFSLTGLELAGPELVVVWAMYASSETEQLAWVPADLLRGGRYAGVLEVGDATSVSFTVERDPSGELPTGRELLRTDLRAQDSG